MSASSNKGNHAHVCSARGCSDAAIGNGIVRGRYCLKHRTITVMRTGSRLAGKYIPSFKEIERVWPLDQCCPRCNIEFDFVRRKGAAYGKNPTLQHFHPSSDNANPLAVVCAKCNHALKNLGDTIDSMSIPVGIRKCTLCGRLKKESDFYLKKIVKSGNSGRQSHCKPCQKSRLSEHTKARRVDVKARALEVRGGEQ